MKKKLVTGALLLAFGATAITGGTLAYFTDADVDHNVMVSGDVRIIQNETDRNGNAFENDQKLVPAVYNGTLSYDGTMKNPADEKETIAIWDKSVENEIDKVISVTNKGTEPAYIRTIVLMENTADNKICEKIHGLWCSSDGQYREWVEKDGKEDQVIINGVTYSIAVCQYDTVLAAGATSDPSLIQVFVDPTADNEWSELLDDGRLNILALSQAVQAQGFENADAAFKASFGDVTGENVLTWLAKNSY